MTTLSTPLARSLAHFNEQQQMTAQQLAKIARIGLRSAQSHLKQLATDGWLIAVKVGKKLKYTLKRELPAELKSVALALPESEDASRNLRENLAQNDETAQDFRANFAQIIKDIVLETIREAIPQILREIIPPIFAQISRKDEVEEELREDETASTQDFRANFAQISRKDDDLREDFAQKEEPADDLREEISRKEEDDWEARWEAVVAATRLRYSPNIFASLYNELQISHENNEITLSANTELLQARVEHYLKPILLEEALRANFAQISCKYTPPSTSTSTSNTNSTNNTNSKTSTSDDEIAFSEPAQEEVAFSESPQEKSEHLEQALKLAKCDKEQIKKLTSMPNVNFYGVKLIVAHMEAVLKAISQGKLEYYSPRLLVMRIQKKYKVAIAKASDDPQRISQIMDEIKRMKKS